MVSSSQAQPPVTSVEEPPPAGPPPAEPDGGRQRPWQRVSLLWRVFAANTVVFVVAVALLAWTPVTVHRVATPRELLALAIGLVLMLCQVGSWQSRSIHLPVSHSASLR